MHDRSDQERLTQAAGTSSGTSQAADAAPGTGALAAAFMQRKIARRLARKRGDENGVAADAGAAVAAASSSTGEPLPGAVRQQFESSLGADLGGVRVHTGETSGRAAESVSAQAYTVGNDIHFATGHYDPGSAS